MIKKILAYVLSLTLLILALSGCGKIEEVENTSRVEVSSTEISSEEEVSSVQSQTSNDNSLSDTQEPSIDPSKEPPLSEYCTKIPVPDFLSEDQQNLYRRAYSTASFMFVGRANIEKYPKLDNQKKQESPHTTVDIDGVQYSISNGRYQNWEDFSYVMMSIYTDEYFNKINYTDTIPLFRSYNDKMCYLDSDRGGNNSISERPDSFKLISKTDNEIKFSVIGHYCFEQNEYETDEEWVNRRDSGEFDYIKSFPITMVKTENVWRFSEFNITY